MSLLCVVLVTAKYMRKRSSTFHVCAMRLSYVSACRQGCDCLVHHLNRGVTASSTSTEARNHT